MLWIWIVGILLAVIFLLSRVRVGVRALIDGDASTVDLTVGPLRLRLYPAKERPEKKKKPAKAEKPDQPAKKKLSLKDIPRPGLADVKSALQALTPAIRKALHRSRRSIRLRPLDLSVTIGGGNDPAAAAELYGYVHGAVWTVMPALEQLLVIPDPHIHIGVDFDAPATRAEGELGLSIRLGTVISAGFGIGFPALRWFLNYQKQHKQPPAQGPQVPAAGAAA